MYFEQVRALNSYANEYKIFQLSCTTLVKNSMGIYF